MKAKPPLSLTVAASAGVLFAALSSTACMGPYGARPGYGANAGPGAFDVAQWQTIDRADVALRLQMPAFPGSTTETSRIEDGRRVTRTSGSSRSRGIEFAYEVTSLDQGFGGSLLSELDDFVDAMIERSEGSEVDSSSAVWTHGYPGTELRLRNESSRLAVTARLYIGRSRAYVFAVGVPFGREQDAASAVEQFFGSVIMDPADAPSADGDGTFDASASAWRWFYPPESHFAVELPGAVSRTETTLDFEDHHFDVWSYALSDAAHRVGIEVAAIVVPPSRHHDELVAAFERRGRPADSVVVSTYEGSRGGHAMKRVVLRVGDDTRHVLLVTSPYGAHVVTVTHATAAAAANAALVERILNSFMLP